MMKFTTYTLLIAALVSGSVFSANAQKRSQKVAGTPVKSEIAAPAPQANSAATQVVAAPVEAPAAPVISTVSFNETEHDFATVKQTDEGATFNFVFTNNGKDPIVVTNAVASCGCTKPEYSSEPVAPGKTGTIKVTYGTKGRVGVFNKTVSVNTTGGNQILKIKGTVE